MKKKIDNVQDGEIFEIAGIEFIKFPATAEGVPVVARGLQKDMSFGDNNDLRESKVLRWLREEFLPNLRGAACGTPEAELWRGRCHFSLMRVCRA